MTLTANRGLKLIQPAAVLPAVLDAAGSRPEQSMYDPEQDNPDQGVWVRVWHGSKLYCVPNIIRHGLKSSDGSEEGHQFFDGKPGVYALPDDYARRTESYMIKTCLPGRDGQYWKFCFEGVQNKSTTQTRNGQLWDGVRVKTSSSGTYGSMVATLKPPRRRIGSTLHGNHCGRRLKVSTAQKVTLLCFEHEGRT